LAVEKPDLRLLCALHCFWNAFSNTGHCLAKRHSKWTSAASLGIEPLSSVAHLKTDLLCTVQTFGF